MMVTTFINNHIDRTCHCYPVFMLLASVKHSDMPKIFILKMIRQIPFNPIMATLLFPYCAHSTAERRHLVLDELQPWICDA